jgi:N-acetylglucosaminyldiphosphoundecaprenol N-acetyl-beta-D-mannosaminyltransferase
MSARVRLGHLPIDVVTRDEALERIAALVEAGQGGTVFTPNVDHVVLAESDERLRRAYAATSLSLVDGTPVLWACRALGYRVPEKISGSDLVAPLAQLCARRGFRLFLLGSTPAVLAEAACRLSARFPELAVAGTDAPRVDMEAGVGERRATWERVRAARAQLVLVALGSPKGELWAHEARADLRPAVIVGVGAGLDFLAGRARRAPAWMSRAGLEWLYRLAHEPRRLSHRYLVRDPRFVLVFARQWWRSRRQGADSPPSG